jgi:hypothetical protein
VHPLPLQTRNYFHWLHLCVSCVHAANSNISLNLNKCSVLLKETDCVFCESWIEFYIFLRKSSFSKDFTLRIKRKTNWTSDIMQCFETRWYVQAHPPFPPRDVEIESWARLGRRVEVVRTSETSWDAPGDKTPTFSFSTNFLLSDVME